ncbi:zinc knuckle [Verticillium dahliae]
MQAPKRNEAVVPILPREAEAHIASAPERFTRRAIKLWTDLHALPETNPLRKLIARMRKFRRFHRSPFFQLATALNEIPMENLETINPFTLPPWMGRMAAALTLRNPRQQSGQEYVRCIYEAVTRLRETGNIITAVWLPSHLEDDLLKNAKGEARKWSREGASPEKQSTKMRSTTLMLQDAKYV